MNTSSQPSLIVLKVLVCIIIAVGLSYLVIAGVVDWLCEWERHHYTANAFIDRRA